MNSGEGGFLITDDAQVMARAVMLSGSYMLYEKHLAAPPPEAFETLRYETPNISGRMDHLRAAICARNCAVLKPNARLGTAAIKPLSLACRKRRDFLWCRALLRKNMSGLLFSSCCSTGRRMRCRMCLGAAQAAALSSNGSAALSQAVLHRAMTAGDMLKVSRCRKATVFLPA